MDEQTEMVTISKKEYDRLVKDQKLLSALQALGVDNWEGYGEACRSLWDDE